MFLILLLLQRQNDPINFLKRIDHEIIFMLRTPHVLRNANLKRIVKNQPPKHPLWSWRMKLPTLPICVSSSGWPEITASSRKPKFLLYPLWRQTTYRQPCFSKWQLVEGLTPKLLLDQEYKMNFGNPGAARQQVLLWECLITF